MTHIWSDMSWRGILASSMSTRWLVEIASASDIRFVVAVSPAPLICAASLSSFS